MKREDQNEEFDKLRQEYENSIREGRYPVLESDDLTDLAQYFYERGDVAKAKEVADVALEMYPGADAPTLFMGRYVMLEDGDMDKARQLLESVADKTSLDYVFDMAEWMAYSKRMDDANALLEQRFDTVYGEGEIADYAEDACRFFLNFQRVDLARPWLTKMPSDESARYALLAAEVDRMGGDWEACRKRLAELTEKDPFSLAGWTELAKILFDLDRQQEAGEAADFALAIDASSPDAQLIKGDIMTRLGNNDEAEKYYRLYLDANPASPAVLNQLAVVLAAKSEDNLPESLKLVKRAKGFVNKRFESQGYADLLQTEALIHNAMGNADKALACVDKLEALKGKDSEDVELLRAQIYMHNGKCLESCLIYDMLLRHTQWRIDLTVRIALLLFDGHFYEIGNYELNQALLTHPETEHTAELLALKAVFAYVTKNTADYESYRAKALAKNESVANIIFEMISDL